MAGFMIAGPNEALIRSGGGAQPRVVVGGRIFVLPIFQDARYLSLEIMTLTVATNNVYTAEGVSVSVDGVAQVKVARSEEAIRTAAQQFLGSTRYTRREVHEHVVHVNVENLFHESLGTGTNGMQLCRPDPAHITSIVGPSSSDQVSPFQ